MKKLYFKVWNIEKYFSKFELKSYLIAIRMTRLHLCGQKRTWLVYLVEEIKDWKWNGQWWTLSDCKKDIATLKIRLLESNVLDESDHVSRVRLKKLRMESKRETDERYESGFADSLFPGRRSWIHERIVERHRRLLLLL